MTTYRGFKIPENMVEIEELNKSYNSNPSKPELIYIDKEKFPIPLNTGITSESFLRDYEHSYERYIRVVKKFIDEYHNRNNTVE